MIRLKRISASQELGISKETKFSADDVLQLLLSIEELKRCSISLGLSEDKNVEFVVGEYAYSIPTA